MAKQSLTTLHLPSPLVRRVRGLAARESRPVSAVLSKALQAYQTEQEEEIFRATFRAAARDRGLTSQRAITDLLDAVRTGR